MTTAPASDDGVPPYNGPGRQQRRRSPKRPHDARRQPTTPGQPLTADQTREQPLIEPSWGQLSALVLAGTALSRLLTAPALLEPGELGPIVDEHLAGIRARLNKVPFVRGDVLRAHGYTTRYLHRWFPANLDFAGREVNEAAKELADAGSPVARRYRQNRPPGRRLAWAADLDNLSAGLMLDRLHYTHYEDCVTDRWMMQQAEHDAALGVELAGDMFAGVRILAPLTPRSSVHLLAGGRQHPIGECEWCAGVSPWATASAGAAEPQQGEAAQRDEDAA